MKVVPSRPDTAAESASARRQATAMIEIDRVSQVFQTSGRQNHLALSEISLTIEDGAFVSILGPSGCGKSTLLYIVGGFVSPTEGVARMKGKAITGPGPDRGPVFQEFALFPWKSVLGNVMYGPRQQGVKHAQAEAQSRALIEMVGLKGFEHFYPKELSGGMKQRVALARTLAYHPAVLLMDEPFGSLDAHTRTRLQNDLLNIWERDRKTVLGNVMYGPRQQGVKHTEAEAQSRCLIEMVGLKGFEDFYPKELSGGMKQRVALARTLAYHPAVLLMDEPFGALDAHTRTRL